MPNPRLDISRCATPMCAGRTTPAAFAIRPIAANVNSVYGMAPKADRDRDNEAINDLIEREIRLANVKDRALACSLRLARDPPDGRKLIVRADVDPAPVPQFAADPTLRNRVEQQIAQRERCPWVHRRTVTVLSREMPQYT